MQTKIFVEVGDQGISRLTLEPAVGEDSLVLLKQAWPALRLFETMVVGATASMTPHIPQPEEAVKCD
jgi:hypothetical protein